MERIEGSAGGIVQAEIESYIYSSKAYEAGRFEGGGFFVFFVFSMIFGTGASMHIIGASATIALIIACSFVGVLVLKQSERDLLQKKRESAIEALSLAKKDLGGAAGERELFTLFEAGDLYALSDEEIFSLVEALQREIAAAKRGKA